MAYCVNCGVKLAKTEKKCPLCNTIVLNPKKSNEVYKPAYSNKVENFKKINYKYISKLITIILMILGIISVICNYIISGQITWSIYVICSIIYLVCQMTFMTNKKLFLSMVIELISTELFLLVIAYLNNGMQWYLYLVLPFIFAIWLFIVLCIFLIKRKTKSLLRRISACFIFGSVELLIIEIFIDLYSRSTISLTWSVYAMLPLTIVGTLIFILSFNKKVV